MLLHLFMMFPTDRRLINSVLLDAKLSTKARRVVLLRGVGRELLVVVEADGGGVLAVRLHAKLPAETFLQVRLRLVSRLLLHDAVLGVDVGAELVETGRGGKNWDLEIEERNFEISKITYSMAAAERPEPDTVLEPQRLSASLTSF